MVPSGIPPQLTAMYCACLRALKLWMIRGKISFPTPLSPVISTVKSVGATCTAFSIARFSLMSFPIISKRCLIVLMSSMWFTIYEFFILDVWHGTWERIQSSILICKFSSFSWQNSITVEIKLQRVYIELGKNEWKNKIICQLICLFLDDYKGVTIWEFVIYDCKINSLYLRNKWTLNDSRFINFHQTYRCL